MDFIEALPRSDGMETVVVVMDLFTKMGHFIAPPKMYNATLTVEAFQQRIDKLHGMPRMVVSDRDSIFLDQF